MLENEWNMLEYVGSHKAIGVRGYISQRDCEESDITYVSMEYVGMSITILKR